MINRQAANCNVLRKRYSPGTTTRIMSPMKQLTILGRPITAEAVLKVLGELDVNACLVQEAKGYSRQKDYLERYRGSEYSMAFLPKVEISVWVSDTRVQEVEEKMMKVARTGRIGDGKVFVMDVGWPGAMEF